jgi:hypothetical protein
MHHKLTLSALFVTIFSLPSEAHAQLSDPQNGVSTPRTSRTSRAFTVAVSTPDYTERLVGGDQVVEFPGDDLPADPLDAYGDMVLRPPRVLRAGLVRPRLNFVPELLKTVENL